MRNFLGLALLVTAISVHAAEPPQLYATYCAMCHGADRTGGTGPALLPESLERVKRDHASKVIAQGAIATQMPAFGSRMSGAEIEALTKYLYTPPAIVPTWNEAQMRASHQVLDRAPAKAKPVYKADPLNVFLVVETGDHHITVLDGDKLEPIHRFATRYALHGGPKYSPEGRFVYLASRDGWVTKYDLYRLKTVAEIRVGLNTRNVAVSDDGRHVLVGNILPRNMVLLSADDLALMSVIPVANEAGQASRVSAVYQAAPRHSFVAALKDIPEVWELRIEPKGFTTRRYPLPAPAEDFAFDAGYRYIIGAPRDGSGAFVLDLDTGNIVARPALTGMPHLVSGIFWESGGRTVFGTQDLMKGGVTILSPSDWSLVKRIETLGPGFFMRGHENSRYVWSDVFSGPHKDALHVIDRQSLEIIKTVRPAPGRTAGHVEFDRYGRYALVSVWEMDGALVVYDARTLEEVKRLPMSKPVGKYNVFNKINRSTGTSH
jgi:hypothetical protein